MYASSRLENQKKTKFQYKEPSNITNKLKTKYKNESKNEDSKDVSVSSQYNVFDDEDFSNEFFDDDDFVFAPTKKKKLKTDDIIFKNVEYINEAIDDKPIIVDNIRRLHIQNRNLVPHELEKKL